MRGTRRCYKEGPGRRALSVPECPVLRVRTPVSLLVPELAADDMQLLLATCFLLCAATLGPAAGMYLDILSIMQYLVTVTYKLLHCTITSHNVVTTLGIRK